MPEQRLPKRSWVYAGTTRDQNPKQTEAEFLSLFDELLDDTQISWECVSSADRWQHIFARSIERSDARKPKKGDSH